MTLDHHSTSADIARHTYTDDDRRRADGFHVVHDTHDFDAGMLSRLDFAPRRPDWLRIAVWAVLLCASSGLIALAVALF